jgi:hypothetical protein
MNMKKTTSLPLLMLAACLLGVVAGRLSPLLVAQASAKPQAALSDISGMYTFLREGEFVQLTVEDGKLAGYLSRFGDTDSDREQIIEQFFEKTSLEGDRLSFNTKKVHGRWYDFTGTVTVAAGEKPEQEGYRVIKGTLIQHTSDAQGAEKAQQRQVEFKSFPPDLSRP